MLFITTAYPADEHDARGTFVHTLARALVREGVAVTVVAPGAPDAPAAECRDGVEVRRAQYWFRRGQRLATGLGGIIPNIRARPWLAVQVPTLVAALTRCAIREARGADLVHAHWVYPCGLAGLAAARRHRIPLVLTSHGGDLNLAARSPLLRRLSAWIARQAAVCVGVSDAMVERFRQIGVAPRDIRLLPLGADTAAAPASGPADRPDAFAAFAGFEGLRVVYAGSLIPRKSVDTLLLAQAELERRGCRIATLLVGTGPSEPELRRLVRERGIANVHFAGQQAPSRVASLMALGETLVLPSLAEGRGLVLVEAMSLGLPVVASDIPGPRELVRPGESGLLFPPKHVAGLADALERLARDAGLRAGLGRGARELVEREGLTMRASARLHRELYTEVLARGRFSPNYLVAG